MSDTNEEPTTLEQDRKSWVKTENTQQAPRGQETPSLATRVSGRAAPASSNGSQGGAVPDKPKRSVGMTFGDGELHIVVKKLRLDASENWTIGFMDGPIREITSRFSELEGVEYQGTSSLVLLIDRSRDLLAGYTTLLLDCMCEYSPDIAEKRAAIRSVAYNDELIDAFVEMLRMEFPLDKTRSLFSGLRALTTRMS